MTLPELLAEFREKFGGEHVATGSEAVRLDEFCAFDRMEEFVARTWEASREAALEEAAVAVWKLWGENGAPLENTDSTRAFHRAVERIRNLKALTSTEKEI